MMALNPLKVFMFVVGGTAAAAATALYSGAMKTQTRLSPGLAQEDSAGGTSVALRNDAAPTDRRTAGGKGDKPSAAAQAGASQAGDTTVASLGTQSVPGGPAVSAPATSEVPAADAARDDAGPASGTDGIPTFDVLRVEPDGSMVVAGRAAPDAKVDLVEGGRVLGSAAANEAGDFALVLDDPLRPGDHQLQLSGTMANGDTETSAQTAVISVPQDGNGQVLAMVDEPGKPSRVLTAPEAPVPAKPDGSATQSEDAPADTTQQTASAQAAAGEARTSPAQSAAPAPAVTVQAEPKPAASGQAATGGSDADARQAALAEPTETSPSGAGKPAASPSSVSVQAVEIEGRRVYVAGLAAPGSTVRVYANDVLLGDAKTSAAGQFLIETTRDLAVGTYAVRADMLNARGSVAARAEVPFEREAGEAVAAVAPELQAAADAGSRAAPNIASPTTAPPQGAPAAQTAANGSEPEAAPPTTQAPRSDISASGQAAPAATLESVPARQTGAAAPDGGDPGASPATAEAPQPGTAAVGQAAQAPAPAGAGVTSEQASAAATGDPAPQGQPGGTATASQETERGVAPSQPDISLSAAAGATSAPALPPAAVSTSVQMPATAGSTPADAAALVASAGDQASAAAQGAARAAGGEPVTAIAPKLQNVDAAVIIRRGDSLWRISRRVYGLGTRYSTLYLANSDQIRNPDLIMPGQVFAVPAKSQQGETADLDAMGEQMTTALPEADAEPVPTNQ